MDTLLTKLAEIDAKISGYRHSMVLLEAEVGYLSHKRTELLERLDPEAERLAEKVGVRLVRIAATDSSKVDITPAAEEGWWAAVLATYPEPASGVSVELFTWSDYSEIVYRAPKYQDNIRMLPLAFAPSKWEAVQAAKECMEEPDFDPEDY